MKLEVLYFAALRDQAGVGNETLTVPDSVRTAAALLAYLDERSALRGKLASVRVAINERFADADERLSDGDTVALIPPVQGG